jgi:8-oxo-dGTP pyrophosphatase MutT (NUDIX family)
MKLTTVYLKDKPIYLSSELSEELLHQAQLIIQYSGESDIDGSLKVFEETKSIKSLLLFSENYETLLQTFFGKFKTIEASGGVVFNPNNEALFIYRYDRWDLPKGKLEKNETPEIGGIREVEEECGVTGLSIQKKLTNTYHCFEHNNEKTLKITHWYKMHCNNGEQTLVPQTEEGITEVKWFSKGDLPTVLNSAYGSIQSVIKQAFE